MRNKALVVSFSDDRNLLLIRFADAAVLWQCEGRQRCEPVQRLRQDHAWLLAPLRISFEAIAQSGSHGPYDLEVVVDHVA